MAGASAAGDCPMSLENFVRTHQLPAVVRVTEGIYSTDVISDFSLGDVIRILPPKGQSRPRGYDPDGDVPPFDVVNIVTEGTGEVKTHSVYSGLHVCPVHSLDSTAFQPPMDLRELLRKRGAVFPVDVVVTEGEFKSDNVRLKVGSRLVVYKEKTVKVVLAESGDRKLAIREDYQEPVDFLLCMRINKTTGDRIPIRIPLFTDCLFEECLDAEITNHGQSLGYTLAELVHMFLVELPVNVELVRSDPTVPDDQLATIGTITVRGEYADTFLVARKRGSTDKTTAFEMPTHADIKVKLCQRRDQVSPRVVAQHQAIEFLPLDAYNEKLTKVTTYESLVTPPPLPPRPSNLPYPPPTSTASSNDPSKQNIPAVPLRRDSLQRGHRPPSHEKSWRQTSFHPDPGYLDHRQGRSRPLSVSDTHLQQRGSMTLPAQTALPTRARAKDGGNVLVQGMSRMFGAVTRKVGEAKAHLRHSKE
uniref:Uncharacterized protein n=1 Tax=Branchiostoma floridae TaxID=7739 RepID=C3YQV4_BRAFL|eukprot:XP_002601283.1 hypothetical protein BRAFLDRAFT_81323 [Branchiostoma floridae]